MQDEEWADINEFLMTVEVRSLEGTVWSFRVPKTLEVVGLMAKLASVSGISPKSMMLYIADSGKKAHRQQHLGDILPNTGGVLLLAINIGGGGKGVRRSIEKKVGVEDGHRWKVCGKGEHTHCHLRALLGLLVLGGVYGLLYHTLSDGRRARSTTRSPCCSSVRRGW